MASRNRRFGYHRVSSMDFIRGTWDNSLCATPSAQARRRELLVRPDDTTDVTDHRDHLREHLDQVRRTGRPMFILNQGGEAEAVVLSSQAYDTLAEKAALADSLTALDRSMDDIQAGRTKPMRESMKKMIESFGGTLET